MRATVREEWKRGDPLWWDSTRGEATNVPPATPVEATQPFTFWSWVRAGLILVAFGVLYLLAIEGLEVLAWLVGGA